MEHGKFRLNRQAVFGIMVLAAIGAGPVHAATLAANPLAPDGVSGDSLCSLREAVVQINTGVAGDCANGSADAYGTNDTITLAAGVYNLTVTGLDEGSVATPTGAEPYEETNVPDATMGDLDILKSVRIVGAGADATIIQWGASVLDADRDRIFHVYTIDPLTLLVNVAIEGLTIQGGRTFEVKLATGVPAPDPIIDPALYDYYLRRAGAGLAVGPGANVVKINPALTGSENAAGRGGSQRPDEGEEGGATYTLTLTGVKVLANQAQGDGAGIYTASPMTETGIVVSGNATTINGGGIYNEGLTTITNSTISGNEAEGGGGVFLTGSNAVTISGTTLSGNRAVGGGAVSGRSGVTINMVNSTLSGNLAEDVGAGFYANGPASLRFVTIANNITGGDSPTAGAGINTFPSGSVNVTLKNVLLAGNLKAWEFATYPNPADDPTLLPANCGSTSGNMAITSAGNNLSSDASCTMLTQATDIQSVDPKIGALADNGGPTLTHALPIDSPAVSAGADDPAVTVDQRGEPRETPPDIGAFEVDNIFSFFDREPGTTPIIGGGGGGGCAVGSDGRLDPTLPAMLAAALAFLGWRRRSAK